MHYVLEIVMPQVDDVELAVKQIMSPFNENPDDDDDRSGHAFWDFYLIGGRWAGHKLVAKHDKEKLAAFYAELKENHVTVSGLQCGKQEISPASQIPMVDSIWQKYFPEYLGRACPLFNHSNNQYENDCLYGDVLRLGDISPDTESQRVIIANYGYMDDKLEAISMFSEDIWNGVTHEKTVFDGKVLSAISMHNERIKNYKPDYVKKHTPDDNWIVVTVDYHS